MVGLLDVPMPVQYLIASFLSAWDICLLGTLCRKLRDVSNNDVVWRHLLKDPLPGYLKRRLFMKRRAITKFIFSKCYTTYLLEGHSDMILDIASCDSKILTASKDCSLREWDTSTKKSVYYAGHTNWVTHADYWDRGIVSCSSDKTVRVWSNDRTCKILKGHASGISCMTKIDGARIATGSHDCTVKIWDLNENLLMANYRQFSSKVENISVFENYLASYSSMDPNFVVRDLLTGEIVINQPSTASTGIGRQHAGLASILIMRNKLITGESTSIKIWDTREKLTHRPAEELKLNTELRRSSTVPALDQDSGLKHRSIPIRAEGARGVFNMKLMPETNILFAGVYGLCGLVGFDLR
jgi:WD40 repeat protein